jgi:uncharacterized protein YndB with AHSA1/START domain
MSTESTDRIERRILLRAPRARVWRTLTDAETFGDWFGVKLAGKRFAVGERTRGHITYPGYEWIEFDVSVERMEPERVFAWRWHPHPIEKGRDYAAEPTTLVVFELADAEGGTLLTLTESGFDEIPLARRLEAFRGNAGGWDEQMANIEKAVVVN